METEADIALAGKLKTILLERCADKLARQGAELLPIEPQFLVEPFSGRAPELLKEPSLEIYVDMFDLWTQYPDEFPDHAKAIMEKEFEVVAKLFSNWTRIAGTKARTEFWFFPGMLRDLRKELLRVLTAQWNLPPSDRKPLVFRLVGLGIENGEYGYLLEFIGDIMDSLGGPGKREVLAEELGIQFRLYDRLAQILAITERDVVYLERAHPWSRGRTRVSFTDLTIDELFHAWGSETTALVMTRNTMRETLFTECRGFLQSSAQALIDGGILVLGPTEGIYLKEIYRHDYSYGYFKHVASFGPGNEEGGEIFRRDARRRPR